MADSYRRLALFDIDGTLVHCGATPRRVFRQALEQVFGTAGPIDGWVFDGKTDPRIVRELMEAAGRSWDQASINRALDIYAEAVKKELPGEPNRKVYPGVRELLEELASQPVLLGLLTGNVRKGARAKLESLGLWGHFPFGAFADDSPIRKELADVAVQRALKMTGRKFSGREIVIIGDTEHDIRCGKHLGAKSIGVGTARSTAWELLEHGADHAFADLSDHRAVIRAIMD
jgi:phosphoglycolate phosphatase-like HAD superfamily hydrolase